MLKYFFLYKANVIRLLLAVLGLMCLIYLFHSKAQYNIFKALSVFTGISVGLIIIYWLLVIFKDVKMKYYAYFVSMTTLTCIIYSTLIMDGFFNEEFTSIVFHFVIPIFALFDYIFICNIKRMNYKNIYKFLFVPLLYILYLTSYILITGEETYKFIDVNSIAIPVYVKNLLLIVVIYMFICVSLTFINNITYKEK